MIRTTSYYRIFGFAILLYIILAVGDQSGSLILQSQKDWFFWGILVFVLVLFEICFGMVTYAMMQSLSDERKAEVELAAKKKKEASFKFYRNIYLSLVRGKEERSEEEIVLDHNYDGIKELDNNLPPWWVYGFYMTIIFAAVYLVRFHVMGGDTQEAEYEKEVAEAKIAIAEYKKHAKDLVDINTVEYLSEAADLSAGKKIFDANCVACHKADMGGGIGPNLVDEYWVLGGGIKNIFKTISEGGRAGKGMIAWKTTLKPNQMAQVASYIISLEGTTPKEPKAPEGEIWEKQN